MNKHNFMKNLENKTLAEVDDYIGKLWNRTLLEEESIALVGGNRSDNSQAVGVWRGGLRLLHVHDSCNRFFSASGSNSSEGGDAFVAAVAAESLVFLGWPIYKVHRN